MAKKIKAPITGNMWKIEVAVGAQVAAGDILAIMESMKMEIPIETEEAGTVKAILIAEGQSLTEGDELFEIE